MKNLCLKIGQQYTYQSYDRTFIVTRVRRDVYWLRDTSINERSRSGTKKQILEDIATTLETGFLPPPVGPRW